jgi:hypothetical protein
MVKWFKVLGLGDLLEQFDDSVLEIVENLASGLLFVRILIVAIPRIALFLSLGTSLNFFFTQRKVFRLFLDTIFEQSERGGELRLFQFVGK